MKISKHIFPLLFCLTLFLCLIPSAFAEGKAVRLPGDVSVIENEAFYNCTDMESVTIPASVMRIGRGAFYGCTHLTDVYYEGTAEDWNNITIGANNGPLTGANIYFAGIAIDASNFPDEHFRSCVSKNCDTIVKDGYLSSAEIAAVTWLDCSGSEEERGSIVSLDGIGFFTALQGLDCSSNALTALDLSANTALTWLDCSNNALVSLDVAKCAALETMWCYNNQLTALNLRGNPALLELWCNGNQLGSLDVSGNPALEVLWCYDNGLTSLSLAANHALTTLSCAANQLTSLDVSANPALTTLWCFDNQLTSLDITGNPALRVLGCYQNEIRLLDLNGCPLLQELVKTHPCMLLEPDDIKRYMDETGSEPVYLLCDEGLALKTAQTAFPVPINETTFPDEYFRQYVLAEIDTDGDSWLSESEAAETAEIDYYGERVADLTGSEYFFALKKLSCNSEALVRLDLSSFPLLERLVCGGNRLEELDLSNNPVLNWLDCRDNQLKSLNVSRNTSLLYINCSRNSLTELDVSMLPELYMLHCNINSLDVLDVTHNPNLSELVCGDNRLRKLDVSSNTKLETLYCENNLLTSLTLGENEQLRCLTCEGNRLSALHIEGCPVLTAIIKPQYLVPDDNMYIYESFEPSYIILRCDKIPIHTA